MTLAELRALVILNVGGRTDKNTIINAALEGGLKQSTRLHFFKCLKTESDVSLAESATYIDLPSTSHQLLEARLINDTSSHDIKIKTKNWIVSRYPNISADSEGIPVFGYIEDKKLYLYPIADDDYTVRITVITNPTFDSDDDTENPVPSLDMALVSYATGYLMKSIQMFEFAAPWDNDYLLQYSVAKSGDGRSPEVMQLQPFKSGSQLASEGLSRDADTGVITGHIEF